MFWNELPKPLLVLAPLANVTDAAFRRIIAKYSKPWGPHVMYTEFVSADGLIKGNKDVLVRDLAFTDAERPVVAQFFTSDPEVMEKAAALAAELGFDGIDINMGCPDRSVEKGGAGAALIKNPSCAKELIRAAKRGTLLARAGGLPVSIKTRLGYNKDVLEEWLPALLEEAPAAVTVHARTRREMSKVPARFERVRRAVEIRDEMKSETLILGNGDVQDIEDANAKIRETGADGAMLGRAIFGRPWLFAGGTREREQRAGTTFSHSQECENVCVEERLRIAIEHAKLFEELLGDFKSFSLMKKHFKAYVEGFPGAKELRIQLMETESAAEAEEAIEDWLKIKAASEPALY